MITLKEAIIKQFKYCKAIAKDILQNEKSKEIQEYAMKYANIESPLVGGTEAEWIRINWGDIYIFLHDNGKIDYQLDPIGAYGAELIDVHSEEEFLKLFDELSEEEILKHHYVFNKNSDYSQDCPQEYLPMTTFSKFKCKYCNFSYWDIDGDVEEALWGHIQMCHEDKFEEIQNLETPFMIEECYEEVI